MSKRHQKVLSISIAAYNVSGTIKECLTKFLQCRHLQDLEVLVIDDGSTDNTRELVQQIVKQAPAPSIKLISKPNGGWGSTLNKGIEIATGKYFRQLDGDDYYDPYNLDLFVEYLKTCQDDLVVSPFCHFADDTGAITKFFGNDPLATPCETIYLNEFDHLYPPAMHSVTVKTELLRKNHIKITEHCFYTDVEFVLKALNHVKTLSFFELPIYYYRLGRDGQSMSISGVRRHYQDHQKMLLGMYRYVYTEATSAEIKQILLRRLIEATMYQYKMYMALDTNRRHRAELAEFDQALQETAPECYHQNYGLPVKFMRRYKFRGYKPLAILKNYQDKKHEVFLYEK